MTDDNIVQVTAKTSLAPETDDPTPRAVPCTEAMRPASAAFSPPTRAWLRNAEFPCQARENGAQERQQHIWAGIGTLGKMNFGEFFKAATGNEPYDYQCRLACGDAAGFENPETMINAATQNRFSSLS